MLMHFVIKEKFLWNFSIKIHICLKKIVYTVRVQMNIIKYNFDNDNLNYYHKHTMQFEKKNGFYKIN